MIQYHRLPTEQINLGSKNIDRVSIKEALLILNKEDSIVPLAVRMQFSSMEKAVQLIVHSLKNGGRMFFIGAGTSGRLGVLEAAECPPTFNTSPDLVQAFMAGGKNSVFRSKEGAEDQGKEAALLVQKKIRSGDVVVGITASGVTAFVQEGLKKARQKKAKTILVCCNPGVSKTSADVVVAVNTGPEVIAGSTRLKAGTATKLVLNSLTVVSMIQLGKVSGNLMADLQPRSRKLYHRAVRLISTLGKVSTKQAEEFLRLSGHKTKTAILMAQKKI